MKERAHLALATINPLAIQRNISISFKGEEDLVFEADPGDMDIILNNLLSNAVKYNRDGGSVEMRILKQAENVEIVVKDTGIGMNEEEVSRLFNEFVRIKNRLTRGITGSGLGLSIVHKISELYGGHIQVDSKPDMGSEFRVILPVQ